MAKQTKGQETVVKENLTEKEVSTVEKIETVIKEDVKENIVIEDNTPEVKEDVIVKDTPVKKNTIEEKNSNKAVKIIQKRPSHYSLLMEDGRQMVVHKSLFDKSTMTVIEDK
jgi:hypothetical protein